MKHRIAWLGTVGAITAVGALVLSGCSTAGDTPSPDAGGGLTPITLQLQWVAQAQFAGYYAAVDRVTTKMRASTSPSSRPSSS